MFKNKFIAFIDVLGFKSMVAAAEKDDGGGLSALLDLLKKLGSSDERRELELRGSSICPQSAYIEKGVDFRLTQISDCVIISSEISPAGVINIVSRAWDIVFELLESGVMCRGYISRGSIFHTDSQVIGSGYQQTFQKEREVVAFKREADERGTPFVEVDRTVADYVAEHGDACVKEKYSRCVADDGEVVALFPFKRMSHSFIVAGFGVKFDADREKRDNDNVRRWVTSVKERVAAAVDRSNPDAIRKSEHYIGALNAQLDVCNRTARMIERLRQGQL